MAPKRKNAVQGKLRKSLKQDRLSVLSEVEIGRLGDEITTQSKYNSIVVLLQQFEPIINRLSDVRDEKLEKIGRLLLLTLFQCFEKLITDGKLVSRQSHDEKKRLVVSWLTDKYGAYKKHLNALLLCRLAYEASWQVDALELLLKLVRLESAHMGTGLVYFAQETYSQVLTSLLWGDNGEVAADGTSTSFLVLEFTETLTNYWDLEYYFAHSFSESSAPGTDLPITQSHLFVANFLTCVSAAWVFRDGSVLTELKTWTKTKLPGAAYKATQFKQHFQNAFLKVLQMPMTSAQSKYTLTILHKRIIPKMSQPQSLLDFLTECYDLDDAVVPMLALNSLYELMKRYNLEYPDFYTKLYSLLTPAMLYTRHRSRFMRLCDLFLSSTHLLAALVASFIKRLARISILGSAPGVVIVIPLIYNLLKRHPSCMIMLHNPIDRHSEYRDPFRNEEKNPLNTRALESSIWEMESIMLHYHPNIATLAKIFGEPFTKHSYNLEDFLDWSYISLWDNEKTRKYRGLTALEFDEFDLLFDQSKEGKTVYASGWCL